MMIVTPDSARLLIQRALSEIKKGNTLEAQKMALQASESTSGSEDPWLILAYLAEPEMGFEYIKNALTINPNSTRAWKGVHYLIKKVLNDSEQKNVGIDQRNGISEMIISEEVHQELISKLSNQQPEHQNFQAKSGVDAIAWNGVHHLNEKVLHDSEQKNGSFNQGDSISERIISEEVQQELISKLSNLQPEHQNFQAKSGVDAIAWEGVHHLNEKVLNDSEQKNVGIDQRNGISEMIISEEVQQELISKLSNQQPEYQNFQAKSDVAAIPVQPLLNAENTQINPELPSVNAKNKTSFISNPEKKAGIETVKTKNKLVRDISKSTKKTEIKYKKSRLDKAAEILMVVGGIMIFLIVIVLILFVLFSP